MTKVLLQCGFAGFVLGKSSLDGPQRLHGLITEQVVNRRHVACSSEGAALIGTLHGGKQGRGTVRDVEPET